MIPPNFNLPSGVTDDDISPPEEREDDNDGQSRYTDGPDEFQYEPDID